jgi:hypothetical protein
MTFALNKDNYFNHLRATTVNKIPQYDSLSSVGDEPGMIGDVIIDNSTGFFCWHNGITWTCSEGGGSSNLVNIGNGQDIYNDPSNPAQIRTIQGAFNNAVSNLLAEDVIVNDPSTNPTPSTNGNIIGTDIVQNLLVLISPLGNDINDGITNPVQTLARAIEIVRFRGFVNTARITFAPGNYNITADETLNFQVGSRGRERNPLILEGALTLDRAGTNQTINVITDISGLQYIQISASGLNQNDEGKMIRLTYNGGTINDFILGQYDPINDAIIVCADSNYTINPGIVSYQIFTRASVIRLNNSLWESDKMPIIFKNLVFEFDIQQENTIIQVQNFLWINVNTEYRHTVNTIVPTGNLFFMNYLESIVISGRNSFISIVPFFYISESEISAGSYMHIDNEPVSGDSLLTLSFTNSVFNLLGSYCRGQRLFNSGIIFESNNDYSLVFDSVNFNNIINNTLISSNNSDVILKNNLITNTRQILRINLGALNMDTININSTYTNNDYVIESRSALLDIDRVYVNGNDEAFTGFLTTQFSKCTIRQIYINDLNGAINDPSKSVLYFDKSSVIYTIQNNSGTSPPLPIIGNVPISAMIAQDCDISMTYAGGPFISSSNEVVNTACIQFTNCFITILSNTPASLVDNINNNIRTQILIVNSKGLLQNVQLNGFDLLSGPQYGLEINNSEIELRNTSLNTTNNSYIRGIIISINSTLNFSENCNFTRNNTPALVGLEAINSTIFGDTLTFSNYDTAVNLTATTLNVRRIIIDNSTSAINAVSSNILIIAEPQEQSSFNNNNICLQLDNTQVNIDFCNFSNTISNALFARNNSHITLININANLLSENNILYNCTNCELILQNNNLTMYNVGLRAVKSTIDIQSSSFIGTLFNNDYPTGLNIINSICRIENSSITDHNTSITTDNNTMLTVLDTSIPNTSVTTNAPISTILLNNTSAVFKSSDGVINIQHHVNTGITCNNSTLYMFNYSLRGKNDLITPGISTTSLSAKSSKILIECSNNMEIGYNTQPGPMFSLLDSDITFLNLTFGSIISFLNQPSGTVFDLNNSNLNIINNSNNRYIVTGLSPPNLPNTFIQSTNSNVNISGLNAFTQIVLINSNNSFIRLESCDITNNDQVGISANNTDINLSNVSIINGNNASIGVFLNNDCYMYGNNVTIDTYTITQINATNSKLEFQTSTISGGVIPLSMINSDLRMISLVVPPAVISGSGNCLVGDNSTVLIENYNISSPGVPIIITNSTLELVSGSSYNTIQGGSQCIIANNSIIDMSQTDANFYWTLTNAGIGAIAINLDQSRLRCLNQFTSPLIIENFVLGIQAINHSDIYIRRLNATQNITTAISIDSSKLVLQSTLGNSSAITTTDKSIVANNNSDIQLIFVDVQSGNTGIEISSSNLKCNEVSVNSTISFNAILGQNCSTIVLQSCNITVSNNGVIVIGCSSATITDCNITDCNNGVNISGNSNCAIFNSPNIINHSSNSVTVSENSQLSVLQQVTIPGSSSPFGINITRGSKVYVQNGSGYAGTTSPVQISAVNIAYPLLGQSYNDYNAPGLSAAGQMCSITVGA